MPATLKRFLRIILCCCVGLMCVLTGLLSVPAYRFAFHCAPEFLSGRYFTAYNFDTIVMGGAFDEGGLTKLLIVIVVLETFPVLAWYMCTLISTCRKWRVGCTAVFLLAFVLPTFAATLYTWELSRYIAVMGITAKRIVGIRYAILFFFTPVLCAVKWIAGQMTWAKNALVIGVCLAAAYATVSGINIAARRSVASHPRPKMVFTSIRQIWVPSKPDAPTDYGLWTIFFGVRPSK